MSKQSTIFFCSKCSAQSIKWSGRCFECGEWGTLQKETLDKKTQTNKSDSNIKPAEIINLKKIENKNYNRVKTNIDEVDRVLGGGIVPGSLILLSGEPGIGKSTLIAQIANLTGGSKSTDIKILYVSGEESAHQIKSRLERLNCNLEKIQFINELNVEKIISACKKLEQKPSLLIIDSIQTIYTSDVENEIGGINQIKASTAKFLELAKQSDIPVMLIGHITKDGSIAGPKNLEHMVDTVLYLETDKTHHYRILRAVKNRFGSTMEIGIFEMKKFGFCEIKNPSSIFLNESTQNLSGQAISCIMEGVRPFLVETQSLVTKTVFGYPQRKTSGYDLNRLQVLIAVLIKRANINLSNQDVILNIVGGLKTNDTALDLAICLNIISSFFDKTIPQKTIVFGEVGLNGEIRNIPRIEDRIKEAKKLGFKQIIMPENNARSNDLKLLKIKNINDVKDLLSH